jgi:integrase
VCPDGERASTLLVDERIVAINLAFKAKQKNFTLCELELKNIIVDLYTQKKKLFGTHVFNEDNQKVLDTYWESEYANKQNIDPVSAKCDLRRAIEAVGSLSILSASRENLQRQIDSRFKGNRQRRIVARLNQIIKYIKRDIKLRKAPKERRKVRYLTPSEFQRAIRFINDDDIKALNVVCFCTGARLGEAFALNALELRGDIVLISKQLDDTGVVRDTKNRRERQALVNPIESALFSRWISLLNKESLRTVKIAKITKEACRRAFPEDKSKWCTPHDFRHSYAIWLLSKGVSLSLVAQSLGNSISVCQEYYAGFVLTTDSIAAIRALVAKI